MRVQIQPPAPRDPTTTKIRLSYEGSNLGARTKGPTTNSSLPSAGCSSQFKLYSPREMDRRQCSSTCICRQLRLCVLPKTVDTSGFVIRHYLVVLRQDLLGRDANQDIR